MLRTLFPLAVAGAVATATVSTLIAHPDDPKIRDTMPRYEGPGYRAETDDPLQGSGFDSEAMQLLSWVTIPEFGNHSGAMDCWGYTSPSGREYAIIGLTDGTGFVEVTNPGNAQVVGVVSGPNSGWRDLKVYQGYCYSVNESSNGIQVIDMTDIDNGNVALVNTVTTGGDQRTHNVALNPDSGYLYRTGGGNNGLRIYDLSDPVNPEFVAEWQDRYVHDAQIYSFESGQYAGREIAFCCGGFDGGWTQTGLSVVDVTDKDNIFTIDHYQYPNGAYSHQGWLSADEQYFYLDDELDESNFGHNTKSHIIDVSDLSNPIEVGTFSTGLASIDHNMYVKDELIYQANYTSGLRVFDASDPLNPVEVGYFDTHPEGDGANFNGLWSTFPFFDSGTVIASDRERGLFVLQMDQALLEFTYPNGLPETVEPSGGTVIDVQVLADNAQPEPGTGVLHVDSGAGFVEIPMDDLGNNEYEAVFPPTTCGDEVSFYFSAETTGGDTYTDPPSAPGVAYNTTSASNIIIAFQDDFESDLGWAVSGNASSGMWERGVPIGGGDRGDPPNDFDGSGQCYLTENADGDSDVDGGSTTLVSPTLDATGGDAFITYARWYDNTAGGSPFEDIFEVDISNDNGSSWTELEVVGPDGPEVSGGWYVKSFRISDFVTPTDQIKVRFTASDTGQGSVVEAGVDAVSIDIIECGINTEITDFVVEAGTLLDGGIDELMSSDDEYLQTRSELGFTAFEPNVIDVIIGATTTVDSPDVLNTSIESRINNPSGTVKVRFRNWHTNQFEQVASYTITTTEAVEDITGIDATSRVNGAGRIEMSTRLVVPATLTAIGFDAFQDHITLGAQ